MDIFVNINQNSKDLLDIIPVISVIITAWIAFTVYVFNYPNKSYFGSLEIKNQKDGKIIPLLVGGLFIFFTYVGIIITKQISKKFDLGKQIFFLLAMLIMIIIFFGLLIIYYCYLYEKSKYKNIILIFIINIIVGLSIGVVDMMLYLNENNIVIFNIFVCIWAYYLTLMISGLIYCQAQLDSKRLYKLIYKDKEIECYLIGVFNDFFKIKDGNSNITLINKDAIKEIREIGTVGVENNERFKGAKWKI